MGTRHPPDEHWRRSVAHNTYIIQLLSSTGGPIKGCTLCLQMNLHPLGRLDFVFHEPRSKEKLASNTMFGLACTASGGRLLIREAGGQDDKIRTTVHTSIIQTIVKLASPRNACANAV